MPHKLWQSLSCLTALDKLSVDETPRPETAGSTVFAAHQAHAFSVIHI